MKLHYKIICVLLLFSTKVYSQKLEKLDDLTLQDFTIFSSGYPSILSYKSLITFPYGPDPNNAGAKDQYFTVRIESIVRIKLNKGDSLQQFIALSRTFDRGIRFKSIKYYSKNESTISNRKIDEKDLSVFSDSIAYYIDFKKIIKDSVSIIDIGFYSISNSKQNIKLYLDRKSFIKDYSLKVYIPEIYFYDTFTADKCISTQVEEGLLGPLIGYRSPSGNNDKLLSKVLADTFSKAFNTKYKQVFCKTNRISFSMVNPCEDFGKNQTNEIIRLKLSNIVEIN